jgi:anti-sigma factor RsiW
MNCADCRAELLAYLDHEFLDHQLLDHRTRLAERSELESHLADCAACQAAFEAERSLSGALSSLSVVAPPADFEARFWARIARERDAPTGWRARLLTRRFALALGGVAAAALAVVLALRDRTAPDADLPIAANAEDYELLEDPDLDLIEVVDVLEEWDGDQG